MQVLMSTSPERSQESAQAKVLPEKTPINASESPSNNTKRGRRNTILNRKLQARKYHSYRPMSPSRFLDYPLQPCPSLYSYSAAFPSGPMSLPQASTSTSSSAPSSTSNPSAFSTNNAGTSSVAPCVSLPTPIHSRGHPVESLVGKERVDAYLDAIAHLYYRSRSSDALGAGDSFSSQNYDLFQYPTLQLLLSPLREPSPLDAWSAREIALFEAGLCSGSKDFYELHRLIGTKSTNQCVEFYYVWKRSPHFAVWKKFEKQSRGMNLSSKLALWDEMEEHMGVLTRPVHSQLPLLSAEFASVQVSLQKQQQAQTDIQAHNIVSLPSEDADVTETSDSKGKTNDDAISLISHTKTRSYPSRNITESEVNTDQEVLSTKRRKR